MKIFNLDGPFQKYGTMVFDLILLNVIWFVISFFSLGILSGVATVSLYSSIHLSVVKSEGYPLKSFFTKFKRRFLPSFFCSIISFVICGVAVYALWLIANGVLTSWLSPLYFAILIYTAAIIPYATALLSDTNLKTKDVIKYGFLLAIKHLPYTILCIIINVAAIAVVYFTLIGVIFAIAPAMALLSMIISDKILTRYQFAGDEVHAPLNETN